MQSMDYECGINTESYWKLKEQAAEIKALNKKLDKANDVIEVIYSSGQLDTDMIEIVQKYIGIK